MKIDWHIKETSEAGHCCTGGGEIRGLILWELLLTGCPVAEETQARTQEISD